MKTNTAIVPKGKKGVVSKSSVSVSLGEIVMMFKERWLIGALLGLSVAAAIFIFRPKTEPVYSTEVTLLFEPRRDRILNVEPVYETQVRDANELNIHLEQLRSQTFFDYLVNSFTPDEVSKIQKSYKDAEHPENSPPNIAQIIRPNVGVFARRNTTIVSIIVTNKNPENAALIANRYARRYIDYNLDRSNTSTNSAIIFLRNQAEEFRAQVELAESELANYRAKNNVAILSENQNLISMKVSSVGASLVKAQMEQIQLKSVIDKIHEYKDNNKALAQIPQVLSDQQVLALKGRLRELQTEAEILDVRYLRRHPKKLKNQFDVDDTSKRLDEAIKQSIQNIETNYKIAAQYEQALRTELTQAESKAPELDKIAVEYKLLEQDAATKKATYAKIIDRLSDASIASQLENTNIKIFDPAYIPGQASNPDITATIIKAAAMGFSVFIILPLGLGFLDTRIKTVAHVEETLGETLIGVVKLIKGVNELDRAHVFRSGKDHTLVESFRGIQSSINLKSITLFPKSIITTSSMPGDGKSMIASNLASVYASHGKRTLLIDCDLRRPVLHTYFGIDGSKGWLKTLTGHSFDSKEVDSSVVKFSDNFDLLPAGGISKNPTETLESFVNFGLLKYLESKYDLIVLDTPPVAIFPDALLLCRYCNELLFVCKFGSVRVGNMKKTMFRLHETGISILGLIINQMPESRFRNCGFEGYGAYDQDYYRAYAKRPIPKSTTIS